MSPTGKRHERSTARRGADAGGYGASSTGEEASYHAIRSLLTTIESGGAYPQPTIDTVHLVGAAHEASTAWAHAAEMKIAMGTDCGVDSHGTNLELAPMAKAVLAGPVGMGTDVCPSRAGGGAVPCAALVLTPGRTSGKTR